MKEKSIQLLEKICELIVEKLEDGQGTHHQSGLMSTIYFLREEIKEMVEAPNVTDYGVEAWIDGFLEATNEFKKFFDIYETGRMK